ncbi:MAG: hypothetical protein HFJ63_05100 [Atopobiaceae bacterium]|jgi:hypothetical protein|uniref:Uncharacterized protein n=1 Tax=Muricaecibacterium torontonense TaxID=3032871 RepID=A0A4S2F6H2_9ACTN|nr:hypothetical protein [Muricaecibacterium torontonense]MCI8676077.1 hypothetical protein [Atopobiaceae bacterium]TGY63323.1 hypothetical protein E5334_02145 [Muricaecibacterium torontonense]
MNNTLQSVITGFVVFVVLMVLLGLFVTGLRFFVNTLLPIGVVLFVAYIIWYLVKGRYQA